MMKWTRHTDLSLDGSKIIVDHALIKTSPALTSLEKDTLTPDGWRRRDSQPTAYAVRYTDVTTRRQSFEVGGLVVYYHQHDGCLLFVSLVSAPQTQPDSIEAINLSTVRVAGVRWPHNLSGGKGMKTRLTEAAQTMMAAHGALLDDDAWVQVPYWTKAGRARVSRLAIREFKAGKLRNPEPQERHPYRKLAGRFLSFHGVWEIGTATVRVTESPDKVIVGRSILDVVRQPEAVELHNTVLGCSVWRFTPSEFARLEKVLP